MTAKLQTELEGFLGRDFYRFKPFDPAITQFCESLSKALFNHPQIKQFPDLMALGFWLRKTQLQKLEQRFQEFRKQGRLLVPRGLAFHIPPSNVDTMFVYSWVLSLLVGNGNIVRLPSKKTPSSTLLLNIVQETLSGAIKENNLFISYGHEEEITKTISKHADVRIIWGGDSTIQTIRKIPLKPTGKEIVFADRYSFAVIDVVEKPSSTVFASPFNK